MKRKLVYRGALIAVPIWVLFHIVYADIVSQDWTLAYVVEALLLTLYFSFAMSTGTLLILQLIAGKRLDSVTGFYLLLLAFVLIPGTWLGYLYVFYWLWMTFIRKDKRFT